MKKDCFYNGVKYSDGARMCQEGEIHRCDDGEWTNLHFHCQSNLTNFTNEELFPMPEKTEGEPCDMVATPATAGQTFTYYSLSNYVYKVGDKIYGRWVQQRSAACSSAGTNNHFYEVQLISGPKKIGTCSGFDLIQAVINP